MPRKYSWEQFYYKDYEEDTAGLSLAACGAWIRILTRMWHQQTGTLSGDLVFWARLLRAEPRETDAVIRELAAQGVADITWEKQLISITNRRLTRAGKRRTASKKEPPPYTEEFERAWVVYPRKLNKLGAYEKYAARRREGETAERLLDAAVRYAEICRKTDRSVSFIMHPATFWGPHKRYLDYLPGAAGEKEKAAPRGKKHRPGYLSPADLEEEP